MLNFFKERRKSPLLSFLVAMFLPSVLQAQSDITILAPDREDTAYKEALARENSTGFESGEPVLPSGIFFVGIYPKETGFESAEENASWLEEYVKNTQYDEWSMSTNYAGEGIFLQCVWAGPSHVVNAILEEEKQSKLNQSESSQQIPGADELDFPVSIRFKVAKNIPCTLECEPTETPTCSEDLLKSVVASGRVKIVQTGERQ